MSAHAFGDSEGPLRPHVGGAGTRARQGQISAQNRAAVPWSVPSEVLRTLYPNDERVTTEVLPCCVHGRTAAEHI